MELNMKYDNQKVEIIHKFMSSGEVAYIEFMNLTSKKLQLLSLVNFYKRYEV